MSKVSPSKVSIAACINSLANPEGLKHNLDSSDPLRMGLGAGDPVAENVCQHLESCFCSCFHGAECRMQGNKGVAPENVFLHKPSFTSIDYVTRVLKD